MTRAFLVAVAAVLSGITGAAAQNTAVGYPDHSIRLVVPFAPGGSTDSQARIIADFMSKDLKQQVVIYNMGGAGGTIGANMVAAAAPDGYTLITATPSLTNNPFIQKKIGYDPLKSFEAVAEIAASPAVLVVPPQSSIKSVQDAIDMARAHPGDLHYGSAGVGSFAHLSAALFASMAHIEMTHVPYRGAAPALIDLMAGRLQLQFENAASELSQIKTGKLKGIAVGSAAPYSMLPDLPRIAKTVPGYESVSWFGIIAPAKTPHEIIEKLNASINRGLKDPAVQQRLTALGVDAIGGTSQKFADDLKGTFEETKKVAAAINLKPE
jgi:tripartite-type tricarboxylate transporter receptor subunit TctC